VSVSETDFLSRQLIRIANSVINVKVSTKNIARIVTYGDERVSLLKREKISFVVGGIVISLMLVKIVSLMTICERLVCWSHVSVW